MVVPLEVVVTNAAAQVAFKNGWKINGTDNGVCLSKRIHRGSHPRYTADVVRRLDRLVAGSAPTGLPSRSRIWPRSPR